MIDVPRSWRIEHNGGWIFAGVSGDLSWFGQSCIRAGGRWSTHPSWQLVLGVDEAVQLSDASGTVSRGAGLLVPPGGMRRMAAGSAVVHLWVDPPAVPKRAVMQVVPLDRGTVEELVAAFGGGTPGASQRLSPVLADLLGPPPDVDPRLRLVLDDLGRSETMQDLADRAGITARRLRQLAATDLGGGRLRDLRRWHRLREAGLNYPFMSAGDAAHAAGFADQSHLIRTSRVLTSRTFADVARPVLTGGSPADVYRLHREQE